MAAHDDFTLTRRHPPQRWPKEVQTNANPDQTNPRLRERTGKDPAPALATESTERQLRQGSRPTPRVVAVYPNTKRDTPERQLRQGGTPTANSGCCSTS